MWIGKSTEKIQRRKRGTNFERYRGEKKDAIGRIYNVVHLNNSERSYLYILLYMIKGSLCGIEE